MANKNNGVISRVSGKEAQKLQKIKNDFRSYVLIHLGETCAEYGSIIEETQENKIHPNRNQKPKERIVFLQNLSDEKLDYIEQVMADLKRLK